MRIMDDLDRIKIIREAHEAWKRRELTDDAFLIITASVFENPDLSNEAQQWANKELKRLELL